MVCRVFAVTLVIPGTNEGWGRCEGNHLWPLSHTHVLGSSVLTVQPKSTAILCPLGDSLTACFLFDDAKNRLLVKGCFHMIRRLCVYSRLSCQPPASWCTSSLGPAWSYSSSSFSTASQSVPGLTLLTYSGGCVLNWNQALSLITLFFFGTSFRSIQSWFRSIPSPLKSKVLNMASSSITSWQFLTIPVTCSPSCFLAFQSSVAF